jgi:hypothetical protein
VIDVIKFSTLKIEIGASKALLNRPLPDYHSGQITGYTEKFIVILPNHLPFKSMKCALQITETNLSKPTYSKINYLFMK